MIEPRRYFPAVTIGGVIAGVATAVPLIGDLLRCCFCIGVMAGAAVSLKIWLDSHGAENLTAVDAATLGALSGSVSAAANWLVSVPIRVVFGDMLTGFYHSSTMFPDLLRSNLEALYTPSSVMIVMALPVQVALYALMGAVGAFTALQLFFASRKAEG